MSGLGIGMAASLSGARALLGKIPPKVWLALAIAVAAFLGFLWHQHRAHQAIRAAHDAGYAEAAAKIAKQAQALKLKADALNAKIAAEERKRNDEQNRRIAAAADDLRLRGPGKAVCPGSSRPAAPASRPQPASGNRDAAGPQMPSDDLAAVPWGWLTNRAEEHDVDRAEVLSWREWYRRLEQSWPKSEGAR